MFLRRALQHTTGALTLLDDVVFMAHSHPDDWDFYDRFIALAKEYRDRFSFVVALPSDPSPLVCYNNVDDVKHTTSDLASTGALEEFIKLCAEPLIPELTRDNKQQYTLVSVGYYRNVTAWQQSILTQIQCVDGQKDPALLRGNRGRKGDIPTRNAAPGHETRRLLAFHHHRRQRIP